MGVAGADTKLSHRYKAGGTPPTTAKQGEAREVPGGRNCPVWAVGGRGAARCLLQVR